MTRDFLNSCLRNLKALYYDAYGNLLEGSSEENFDLMDSYALRRLDEGFTRSTVTVDIKALAAFSKCIVVDINVLSEKELRQFFKYLSTKSKATSRLYKTQVGSFLKFAKRSDLAELCKTRKSRNEDKLLSPNELLTVDEIEMLIDRATSPRDKALIAVLYDTGAREGELEELRIRDVSFDEFGAVINLKPGKTGARRNRCIFASSYLHQWIDSHPWKKDPNQYLWVSTKGISHISYSTIWLMLRDVAKRSGIQKRVNPHSFRHSRATHLAKYMKEQELKTQLGWTAGSNMAGRYVHMSGEDLDPTMLKMYGIVVDKKIEDDPTRQQWCPRCKEMQNRKATFCFKCGLPLSENTVSEIQKVKNAAVDWIRENPEEFLKMLGEKK